MKTARRSGSGARLARLSIHVVLLSVHGGELVLLLRHDRAGRRGAWRLPTGGLQEGESLDQAAARVSRSVGAAPPYIRQVGAFGARRRAGAVPDLAVGYLALTPPSHMDAASGTRWVPAGDGESLDARERVILAAAAKALREAGDPLLPLALVPATFTLGELQRAHELVLGRTLYKASFRRTLLGSGVVAPTGEWRGDSRGRPAQLFRGGART